MINVLIPISSGLPIEKVGRTGSDKGGRIGIVSLKVNVILICCY